MTTMKEISQATGVSISTVSLVLNNRDNGRVKADVAARIRQVAQDLGYTPNLMARSLRTSRTHLLGFLSDQVATTPYAGSIILGAQEAASTYGYVIITVTADNSQDEEKEILALKRYGVDGFLIAKMSNRYTSIPQELHNYHSVLVNAAEHPSTHSDPRNPLTSISPDEIAIGYDATTRLIQAGCKKIAYVGCSEPMLAQPLRLEGYKNALHDMHIPFNPELAIEVGNNGPALRKVRQLIEAHHPDGIFCFNDARALYVYESAARLNLTIGKDISVVGVDNHRVFAETLDPKLTTVELPHYEMGYWATCKLISTIESKKASDFHLPQTTSPLPNIAKSGSVLIHSALIEKSSVR